jgi:hypothetical protein
MHFTHFTVGYCGVVGVGVGVGFTNSPTYLFEQSLASWTDREEGSC